MSRADSFVPIIRASDALTPAFQNHNLILIGLSALKTRFRSLLPAAAQRLEPWQQSYCSLALAPFPTNGSSARLVLLLTADTEQEVDAVMRLAVPTIPPMVRSPFSNLVPDCVQVRSGQEVDALGLGGVLRAGYWNAEWAWDDASSYR